MKMLKKLMNQIIGKVHEEEYIVSWRRKMTIDGIFWEKVHYPLEKKTI